MGKSLVRSIFYAILINLIASLFLIFFVPTEDIGPLLSPEYYTPLNVAVTLNLSYLCGDSFCTSSEDCNSCPVDCGSCPISGSGGGGGRFSFIPAEELKCESLWNNGPWGDCINHVMVREVIDLNECVEEPFREERSICIKDGEDFNELLKKEEPLTGIPNWILLLIAILIEIIVIAIIITELSKLNEKHKFLVVIKKYKSKNKKKG